MDKRYLDPRRPKGKPTAEDQAEMLAPLEPEIPLLPGSYVSHRWQVARVAGMQEALLAGHVHLPLPR